MKPRWRYVALLVFLLLLLFVPFLCLAKDPVKAAKQNYVPVFQLCSDEASFGSAMAISRTRAITATHMAECPFYSRKDTEGRVIYSDEDFAIVEFPDETFTPDQNWKWVVPKLGERLFTISNGLGLDGGYFEFVVANFVESGIVIFPCAPMGASGAAVYTMRGGFVGIVSQVKGDGFSCVGLVLPPEHGRMYEVLKAKEDTNALHPAN